MTPDRAVDPQITDYCTGNVLIMNSDKASNKMLLEVLAKDGIRGFVVEDLREGLEFLDRYQCDLVLVSCEFVASDVPRTGSWIDQHVVRQLRINQPELPLVMILGPSHISDCLACGDDDRTEQLVSATSYIVQEAVKAGINTILCRPFTYELARSVIRGFLSCRKVKYAAYGEQAGQVLYQIVGTSQAIRDTVTLAKRLATTSAPVLICGESGTGKELFAALIHHCSMRAQGPYIKVNCAALSDSLLDSELFGHERGAFTGAFTQHKGRFERASGGTILLDEITETPPSFQAKLLRVLEQQEFERVGGRESIRVNVRVISTTNKDIAEQVRQGRFRQDLYYRLCSARLTIPPLRERLEDLEDLIWHFVSCYGKECSRTITSIDPGMMEIFKRYRWPGNVRQLRNVVRTCLMLGSGPVLRLSEIAWLMDAAPVHGRLGQDVPMRQVDVAGPTELGGLPLEQIERMAIMQTLAKTAGNRKKAADLLGISDRTLREKIRRYRGQVETLTA